MNELEYARFYETVGKLNGWNFSQLQVSVNGTDWEFNEEVIKRCNKTKILLDIGTGGEKTFHHLLLQCCWPLE